MLERFIIKIAHMYYAGSTTIPEKQVCFYMDNATLFRTQTDADTMKAYLPLAFSQQDTHFSVQKVFIRV